MKNKQEIKKSLCNIIEYIGDNANREGLKETPERILKSWNHFFSGYNKNPKDIFKTFSEDTHSDIVLLKNIDFYSTCEHHFLPFFGKISIAYIPDKQIIGISKLARLVEIFSRRLQIQERLVNQIADMLVQYLKPKGCIVLAKGSHLCMVARGVEKSNAEMVTLAKRGLFNEKEYRNQFFELIK